MPCQTQNFPITAKTIWHGIHRVRQSTLIMNIIFGNETFKINQISQYEIIRHSKELRCECGASDFEHRNTYDIVGYCDTPQGFMVMFECSKCFEKYRHHISSTGRYNLEAFKNDLGLKLHLKARS